MPSPSPAAGICLHHDAEIDALADAFADEREESPAALLIAGHTGQGRRYFASRAAERLRARGVHVFYTQLDFDGYEPDKPDPLAYARHVAAKRGVELDPGDEAWIQRAGGGPQPSLDLFLAAGMLAGRDTASDGLRERLDSAFGLPDPWHVLAEGLAAEERLVVHVVDTAELPTVARELLLDLASEYPRWRTVISCLPDDGLGKLVRSRANMRFEVMALDPGELRGLLEERVTAPGLPDSLYDSIWDQCGGVRSLAAKAAAELEEGVGETSSVAPGALLEQAAAELDEEDAKRLSSFVSLAAMCGDNVPVRELLAYLGVEQDDLEDWIDRLDETVGADSGHALFAERFQHPSLPGRTVYGFADAGFALRLRESFSPEARARLALELMRFLGQRFPVASRATARFYAELARWAGQTEQRLELERELAWWVGPDELERLHGIVSAELRAGSRSPLAVWATVNTVQFGWPPERTLALLHAIRPEGLPAHLHAAHAALLSGLLLQIGKADEALQAAEAGVERAGQDRLLESALWERIGRAHLALGREQEAHEPFAKSARLQEQLLEEGDKRVVPLLEAYARSLRQAGQAEAAERLEAKLASVGK